MIIGRQCAGIKTRIDVYYYVLLLVTVYYLHRLIIRSDWIDCISNTGSEV